MSLAELYPKSNQPIIFYSGVNGKPALFEIEIDCCGTPMARFVQFV